MARKRVPILKPEPAPVVQVGRVTRPVRLDLPAEDHERIQALASKLSLTKSAYVKIALYERMERDERKGAR